MSVSRVAQTHKKSPEDYVKDRVKYAQYFQGNRILPIPKLDKEVEPKTLSFIITEIKTRRQAGIKKETFEKLLRAAGIPGKYFCRRSFATRDVQLLSEELTVKLAGNNITSKYLRLQAEYMGRRRIKVTVCNVPIQLSGDAIAAFLTEYGGVDVVKAKSTNGTAHGDCYFTICGVPVDATYPRLRKSNDDVEGKKPQCWKCKHLGALFQNLSSEDHQTNIIDINFNNNYSNSDDNYHLA